MCIQNQRFLTETLASYFPPSNAPDYSEYEQNYPEFRKNLEKRYPQVCRKCEPQVRDRIRLTGYAAKSDHIRRMMERSRAIGGYQGAWSWKILLVSAGALCWYTSQVGQLLWNAKGAFATNHETFLAEESPDLLSACLWKLDQFSDTRACSELYNSIAGIALDLGLLSIWWNPRLSDKIRRESGRILGLQEYYKLQIIFLLVRFFSSTVLIRSPFYGLDVQMTKAGHSFMLIFTILVSSTIQSSFIVLSELTCLSLSLFLSELFNLILHQLSYSKTSQAHWYKTQLRMIFKASLSSHYHSLLRTRCKILDLTPDRRHSPSTI